MAISSKQVREVEFRERMRGYHQDDVDEFLEQVARGIDVLEAQLAETKAKVARYEANPPVVTKSSSAPASEPRVLSTNPGNDVSPNNDLIQRTLLLAQKAADQAVQEAKKEADRITEDARRRSEEMVEQANRRANALVEERARLLAGEVDSLEQRRSSLVEEVKVLVSSVATAKDEMRASLMDLVDRLDKSLELRLDSLSSEPSETTPSTSQVVSGDGSEANNGTEFDDAGIASPFTFPDSSTYEDGYPDLSRLEDDATVALPLIEDDSRLEDSLTEVDFHFGRPNFQLLDGDGPSAPVLFDDEDL